MTKQEKTINEKISVLVADDNIDFCTTMSFTLRHKGYDVATAADGQEAVEMVKKQPFVIIFMDVRMPVMNGVEAFREIKKIRPESRVMMMTAYVFEDLIEEALKEGIYGVMFKPLDMEKVMAAVEEAGRPFVSKLTKQEKTINEKISVLVADDNIDFCTTMSFTLRHKGYDVATAADGQETVEMVKKQPFDIIFMDVRMPVMNGVEAFREIKKIRPESRVVMMTAYVFEDLIGEVLKEGIYGVMFKPLDMKKVMVAVEEAGRPFVSK